MQCTCSTTLRRVPVTIVSVEKHMMLHIVCVYSPSYPICNAIAP
jgi:hypothetical protein